jgi:dienelactone hydrolase
MKRVCMFALGALMLAVPVAAQTYRIEPGAKVLAGEQVAIQLEGLPPNAEVTIKAERPVVPWTTTTGQRVLYRSEARFKTDAAGKLDLATAKPLAGTYRSANIRGLFWSMSPAKDAPAELPKEWKTGQVRFVANAQGKELAKAELEILPALPEVKTEKVDKFPGALFAAIPGDTPRPALILLGGSEGGTLVTRSAALFASHGFAVLALPYYSPEQWPAQKQELPDLPAAFADIPIERLDDARVWLQARPDVDATRIALHGTSKGAEFALLAAVNLPWVTSVAAIVPTDVIWEGWGPGTEAGKRSSFAYNGMPFAFVPYKDFHQEFMGFQTGQDVKIRRPQDKGRAANPAAAVAARIPVEKIKVPVLVLGGHDDQVWASGMMAQNIAERRAEAGRETVALIYTDAGHFLGGTGFNSTTQFDAGPSKSGGTPEGNAHAQADAWPKTIAFLKRTLGLK